MYVALQQGGNTTSSSLLLDLIPTVSCLLLDVCHVKLDYNPSFVSPPQIQAALL